MPRPDLEYLFVVTYGRSGSTLLMGLLNTLPGYLIRGENRDALHHLFQFEKTMRTESTRGPRRKLREPTHPFFGIAGYPRERAVRQLRRLATETVMRPKEETRVTGFKEIRWYHSDLEDYVAWLREVFPGARFLVNTRNHADVLKSKWWAGGEDKSAHLAEIEERLLALAGHWAMRRTTCTTTTTSPIRPRYAACSPGWARSSTRPPSARPWPSATASEACPHPTERVCAAITSAYHRNERLGVRTWVS